MRDKLRHGAGFIASGLIAFGTDAAVLWVMLHAAGLDPFSGRLIAMSIAMVAAYFAHRRLTFNVPEPPTLKQFAKFASVASTANAINYALYASILLLSPSSTPLTALLIASVVAMMVSYAGFRFGVFRRT